MSIRELIEDKEIASLSEFAAKARNSKGREKEEKNDDLRTCFAKDRDKIIHSHAFRREEHKTQVFINPKSDHIMNRLTHTLEVQQIAKTIAVALSLNETLTEAIALGHDTAHTCFGHAGESALNKISRDNGKGGYAHANEAYRRLNVLSGLNLTYEVLDGIEKHSGLSNNPNAATLEGQIVPFADKIAYLTSDFENAISMGIIGGFDALPKAVTNVLGSKKSTMIDTLVRAVVYTSYGKDHISMEQEVYEAFTEFRKFNFDNIYYNPILVESNKRAKMIIQCLFDFYMDYPEKVERNGCDDIVQAIIDLIAGMTDRYALDAFHELL